jgi:hypothetical protein
MSKNVNYINKNKKPIEHPTPIGDIETGLAISAVRPTRGTVEERI